MTVDHSPALFLNLIRGENDPRKVGQPNAVFTSSAAQFVGRRICKPLIRLPAAPGELVVIKRWVISLPTWLCHALLGFMVCILSIIPTLCPHRQLMLASISWLRRHARSQKCCSIYIKLDCGRARDRCSPAEVKLFLKRF